MIQIDAEGHLTIEEFLPTTWAILDHLIWEFH